MNNEPITPINHFSLEEETARLKRIAQHIGAHPDTYVLDCAHCRPILKQLLVMIATQDDTTAARALLDTLNRAHKPLTAPTTPTPATPIQVLVGNNSPSPAPIHDAWL